MCICVCARCMYLWPDMCVCVCVWEFFICFIFHTIEIKHKFTVTWKMSVVDSLEKLVQY